MHTPLAGLCPTRGGYLAHVLRQRRIAYGTLRERTGGCLDALSRRETRRARIAPSRLCASRQADS